MSAITDYGKVELLLPMRGSNGSTVFKDYSKNALGVIASGSAQISTAQSYHAEYGASGYFAGGTNRLFTSDTSKFYLGSSDFYVSAFVYPTQLSGREPVIISQVANGQRAWALQLFSNAVVWYWSPDGWGDANYQFPTTNSTNEWALIEVARTEGVLYGWKNKVLLGATAHAHNYVKSSADVCIGTFGRYAEMGYTNLSFQGYMQDLMVVRGSGLAAGESMPGPLVVPVSTAPARPVLGPDGNPISCDARIYDRASGMLLSKVIVGVDGHFSALVPDVGEVQRVLVAPTGAPRHNDLIDIITL